MNYNKSNIRTEIDKVISCIPNDYLTISVSIDIYSAIVKSKLFTEIITGTYLYKKCILNIDFSLPKETMQGKIMTNKDKITPRLFNNLIKNVRDQKIDDILRQ